MSDIIKENIISLKKSIEEVKSKFNINRKITLVAISKTFPPDDIKKVFDTGQIVFGESKVQEAENKIPLVNEYAEKMGKNINWHLVGHLQSNKAKNAVNLFSTIHSLDKKSTIKEVSKRAQDINKTIDIFIQVNTSGEESKYGCNPDYALDLSHYTLGKDNVNLVGFMTIAPFVSEETPIAKAFASLRELKEKVSHQLKIDIPYLSMGMTNDWEIAIREGATHLRIGSRIFGKRDYSK
jgi:PLP dependent protein